MASIRFNQIADARGSVNGTVYSRGIGGLYMKNRVSPLNPQSSKQTAVRADLASLAAAWRGLSDGQRKSFAAQVDNYPATNRLGEVYTPSGYQLYMTLNSNLKAVGAASIAQPLAPASFSSNAIDGFTMTLTAGALSTANVNFLADIATGEVALCEMSGSLSAGISSPSASLFKRITTGSADNDQVELAADYVGTYGQPSVGSKIFIRVFRVLVATGQRQLMGSFSTIVTTV